VGCFSLFVIDLFIADTYSEVDFSLLVLRACRRGGETGIFTGMALTLHKSQLHCSGVTQ